MTISPKNTYENLAKMNSGDQSKKWENKTEEGKVRSVANSIKTLAHSQYYIEFVKCGECNTPNECPACQSMKEIFISTIKESGKEGFEKFGMKRIIAKLESDIIRNPKITRDYLNKLKLLKQTFESLHYMTHGRQIKAEVKESKFDFKAFRDATFKEDNQEDTY